MTDLPRRVAAADGWQQVFVYGTLRRGGSNAWRMAGATCLGAASVAGHLFRVSWYPALVLDPVSGPVAGELWQVSPSLLEELDRFEGVSADGAGGEYRRLRAALRLADGSAAEAWVWEWSAGVEGLSRIEGGDWLGARNSFRRPSGGG